MKKYGIIAILLGVLAFVNCTHVLLKKKDADGQNLKGSQKEFQALRNPQSGDSKSSESVTLDEDSDNTKEFRLDHFELDQIKSGESLIDLVGIFNNGELTPIYDLVERAKYSIDVEIYEMKDPNFMDAINRALDRGVKVRIIKDPHTNGNRCYLRTLEAQLDDTEDCKTQRDFLFKASTRKVNPAQYVPFNKFELCFPEAPPVKKTTGVAKDPMCFEHGKIIIADKKVALISTGNFNASNLCDLKVDIKTCNRDFSYVTRDQDVVDGLTKIFDKDLLGKRYNPLEILSDSQKSKLTVSPFSKLPLIEFVKSATHEILIENQYIKDLDLVEALKLKAQALREVVPDKFPIKMVLASPCSFGRVRRKQVAKTDEMLADFLKAGIDVRFFSKENFVKGKNGYMHAKAMVVDSARAWVGSVNGSTTALSANREFGVFFSNTARVDYLESVIKADFAVAKTWSELKENPYCVEPDGGAGNLPPPIQNDEAGED